MRHAILTTLLALLPLGAAAQAPRSKAEEVAMTTLLRVCLDHARGQPLELLAQRAQSGGFWREPDRGGVRGEHLIWRDGKGGYVDLSMARSDAYSPAYCRISVSPEGVDTLRLANEVLSWAAATRPAFTPIAAPPKDFVIESDPKPALQKFLGRPGSTLTVERFDPSGDPFDGQGVRITLERQG